MNLVSILEKVNKLPQNLRDFLARGTSEEEIKAACLSYGIDDRLIENINDSIGLIILGEAPLENLPYIIWENTNLEKGAVYSLSSEINKRIFSKFPEYFRQSSLLLEKWGNLEKNPFSLSAKKTDQFPYFQRDKKEMIQEESVRFVHQPKDLIQLPFKDILKKYPEIEQQLITTSHIMLPDYPEKVRPSIKNWLSDFAYYQNDESNHEALINGYIFQSPNAKNLSSEEKLRLRQLLVSFNNNSILTLDRKIPEIIFNGNGDEKFPVLEPKSTRDKKLEKEASKIISQLGSEKNTSEKQKNFEKSKFGPKIKKAKRKSLTEESADDNRGSFRIKVGSREEKQTNGNDEPEEVDYKKLEEDPYKDNPSEFKVEEMKDEIKKETPVQNKENSVKNETAPKPQAALPKSPYSNEENWQNNVPLSPLRITPYYQGNTEDSNSQKNFN